jgi:hypothetical protein
MERENFRSIVTANSDIEPKILSEAFADAITAARLTEENRTYLR